MPADDICRSAQGVAPAECPTDVAAKLKTKWEARLQARLRGSARNRPPPTKLREFSLVKQRTRTPLNPLQLDEQQQQQPQLHKRKKPLQHEPAQQAPQLLEIPADKPSAEVAEVASEKLRQPSDSGPPLLSSSGSLNAATPRRTRRSFKVAGCMPVVNMQWGGKVELNEIVEVPVNLDECAKENSASKGKKETAQKTPDSGAPEAANAEVEKYASPVSAAKNVADVKELKTKRKKSLAKSEHASQQDLSENTKIKSTRGAKQKLADIELPFKTKKRGRSKKEAEPHKESSGTAGNQASIGIESGADKNSVVKVKKETDSVPLPSIAECLHASARYASEVEVRCGQHWTVIGTEEFVARVMRGVKATEEAEAEQTLMNWNPTTPTTAAASPALPVHALNATPVSVQASAHAATPTGAGPTKSLNQDPALPAVTVPADPLASQPESPSRKRPAPAAPMMRAQEEDELGLIKFRVVEPDGTDESMILLTGLKNIYQKQLPNMPKEYIARLVYDRNHLSMALVKPPLTVVGGITYRPFLDRHFAEIVFCAISASEQVRGYGARLMNHVKDYVVSALDVHYFLTYADNFAIGYFKKQGFTTDITLDKSIWVGYIKDYEGGTLMQWTVIPKVVYLKAAEIIAAQRKAVRDMIRKTASEPKRYSGTDAFQNGALESLPVEDVPGLVEIGWTKDMLRRLGENKVAKIHGPLYGPLKILVEEMRTNPNAWPFVEPVSGVADYYNIITEPMDISTLGTCVENDEYSTVDAFVKDATKIFQNCRKYNEEVAVIGLAFLSLMKILYLFICAYVLMPGTNYVKCANKLEKWFKDRIKTLRSELIYMV
ncbi:histone acetyltransferase [Entophlyctis luteolus]|nr:histone acetyltransferase [Entophlyctis luteolus]